MSSAFRDEGVIPLVLDDLVLQHGKLVLRFLVALRVLDGKRGLRGESLQPLQVFFPEPLASPLVDDLHDSDEPVLDPHGHGQDGGGGEADFLGDLRVEARVLRYVVHDQGGVLLRHPPRDPLPHVQGVVLEERSLGAEGDLEVQLVVLRVEKHEGGGFSLGELGCRADDLGEERLQVRVVRVDPRVDVEKDLKLLAVRGESQHPPRR